MKKQLLTYVGRNANEIGLTIIGSISEDRDCISVAYIVSVPELSDNITGIFDDIWIYQDDSWISSDVPKPLIHLTDGVEVTMDDLEKKFGCKVKVVK